MHSRSIPSREELKSWMEEMLPDRPPSIPQQPKPYPKYPSVFENDPMSPYKVPRTRDTPYVDVVDVIRNKPFKAIYPESFAPVPDYYRENNIPVPYEPVPGSDYARGSLTIDDMLELVSMDQPWALERSQDMQIIRDILQEYLNLALPQKTKSKAIANSIAGVERLMAILDDGLKRAAKKEGKLKGVTRDIFSLLKKMSGG